MSGKDSVMGKFSIDIVGDPDVFLNNLNSFVGDESEHGKIIFDIEISHKSRPLITKTKKDSYCVSYSRPVFYTPFKTYVSDYKLDFIIGMNNQQVVVKGDIKFKTFIIIFLILFACFYAMMFFQFQKDDVLSWIFFILAPIFIFIHFFRGYKLFKKKMKMLFTNLQVDKF
jgi:hypothetical protein